jgi:hypothetical protein
VYCIDHTLLLRPFLESICSQSSMLLILRVLVEFIAYILVFSSHELHDFSPQWFCTLRAHSIACVRVRKKARLKAVSELYQVCKDIRDKREENDGSFRVNGRSDKKNSNVRDLNKTSLETWAQNQVPDAICLAKSPGAQTVDCAKNLKSKPVYTRSKFGSDMQSCAVPGSPPHHNPSSVN